jgi:hypothetical protein
MKKLMVLFVLVLTVSEKLHSEMWNHWKQPMDCKSQA